MRRGNLLCKCIHGLSHGLKSVPRTLFTSLRSVALSSPIHPIKKDDRMVVFFYGVGNGTRTHNARNHNPVLCQLNYTHHV